MSPETYFDSVKCFHAQHVLKLIFLVSMTVCVLYSINGYAQDDVRAVARVSAQKVELGQSINLTIEASHRGNNNIRLLGEPEVHPFVITGHSMSQPIRIVNGVVDRSLTVNYNLRATQTGTFVIKPPPVAVGGKRIALDSIEVTVVDSGRLPRSQSNTARRQGDDHIFVDIRMEPQRPPYVGEQITVQYSLYTDPHRSQVRVSPPSEPSLDEFWVEDISRNSAGRRQIQQMGHRLFEETLLRSYALFPLQPGQATIQGMVVPVTTGGFFQRQQTTEIVADAITVEVQPLPDDAPASFYGQSVGQWQFEVSSDVRSSRVGLPIQIQLRARGAGRASEVGLPPLRELDGMQIIDTSTESTREERNATIYGTKTVHYTIMPTKPGVLTIPSLEFSYFDPQTEQYHTLHSAPITISVDEGQLPAYAQPAEPTNIEHQSDENAGGKNIESHVSTMFPLTRTSSTSTQEVLQFLWFWILLSIPLLGMIVLFIPRSFVEPLKRSRKRRKYLDDILFKAQERLKVAKNSDATSGFDDVAQALRQFLVAGFSVSPFAVSSDDMSVFKELLLKANVPQDLVDEVVDVLRICDSIRFIPVHGRSSDDLHQLVERAERCLEALSELLHRGAPKSKSALSHASVLLIVGALASLIAPSELSAEEIATFSPQIFESFDAQEYDKTITLLKQQYQKTPYSAALHYNLGTTFTRIGDFSRARLHLERAAYLQPQDRVIQHNLALIRQIVVANARESAITQNNNNSIEPELFWWNAAASIPKNYIYFGLLIAAWLGFIGLMGRRTTRTRPTLRIFFTLLAVFGLSMLAASAVGGIVQKSILTEVRPAIILSENVELYEGPSKLASKAVVSSEAYAGKMVRVMEERDNWMRVKLAENRLGWIEQSNVEKVVPGL